MEQTNNNIDLEKLKLEDKKETFNEEDEKAVIKSVQEGSDELTAVDDKETAHLFAKDATWEGLNVKEEIIKGMIEYPFNKPSKIQSTTYPLIIRQPYSHLVAQAPNGAGKTGAFGLGVLSRIDENSNNIQAIIFAHTRDMVNQIATNVGKMAKFTKIKVVSMLTDNKNAESGQVVVITPGNFETQFLKKKLYSLSGLKILVLDEADYMLNTEQTSAVCDKTFKYITTNNLSVQVLFFSATYIPENFKTIKKYFKKALMIEMKKESLTLKNVRQMYIQCDQREKKVDFVEEYLKRSIEQERVIIFVNTRDYVEKLAESLRKKGYKVYILMGGTMDPKERDLTIEKFTKGEIQILITTNVLSRGFDEKLVKLIINFDLPVIKVDGNYLPDFETYLHRIGRTGRFGSKGIGLNLLGGEQDKKLLDSIQDYYKSNIEEIQSMDALIDEFKKIINNKF